MKKLTALSILFISLVFIAPIQVSAATNAGVKPGSFFYFFDTAFENIGLFFTFNPEKKAQKALEHADERLAEAEESAVENNPKAVEKAMAGYEEEISLATEKSKGLKDEKRAEELLNIVSENTAKHQEVLSSVLEKVPEEAKQAILNAIEVSKKGQEEATKQIAELKGEVERLKQEVAELKAKDEEREQKIEELSKQKTESSVIQTKTKTVAPQTSSPSIDVAPQVQKQPVSQANKNIHEQYSEMSQSLVFEIKIKKVAAEVMGLDIEDINDKIYTSEGYKVGDPSIADLIDYFIRIYNTQLKFESKRLVYQNDVIKWLEQTKADVDISLQIIPSMSDESLIIKENELKQMTETIAIINKNITYYRQESEKGDSIIRGIIEGTRSTYSNSSNQSLPTVTIPDLQYTAPTYTPSFKANCLSSFTPIGEWHTTCY